MKYPKYAVVDLETTGQSKSKDHIIQIAIVMMENGEITETYSTFVNPQMEIPGFIQELTNISEDEVRDAPTFPEIAERVYELISDAIFVAHNVEFDYSFLQSEMKRANMSKLYCKTIDTLELCKILFPSSDSYQLGDLAKDLNIELAQAHRADDDALATAKLLRKCWERLLALPLRTLEQIHKYTFQLKSNIAQMIFEAIRIKREQIQSYDFINYRGITLKKQESLIIERTVNEDYPITSTEKLTLLKKSIPNAEKRAAQFQMMDNIWAALLEEEEIAIEASTGIGKSIGYLVPAFYYANQVRKPVLISTYTAHLMDQLMLEELPKLERMVGQKVRAVSIKGMSHYIDLQLFAEQLATKADSYDEIIVRLQILVWLTMTETGDLNELNITGGGMLFVDKIRKTVRAKVKPDVVDFFELAITRAQRAQILVTNHSMLLADMNRKEKVFTKISGIIFDEAHQVVNAAIQQETRLFSYNRWKYIFGQIGSLEQEGYLRALQSLYKKLGMYVFYQFITVDKVFNEMEVRFDLNMRKLHRSILQKKPSVKGELKRTIMWQDIALSKEDMLAFAHVVQRFIDAIEGLLQHLQTQQLQQLHPDELLILQEGQYLLGQLKECLVEWDAMTYATKQQACWVECDMRSLPSSIQIQTQPLQMDKRALTLINELRGKVPLIWTSGTLTVPENERFILDQLHISNDVPVFSYKADASYYSGAVSYIVSDMPDIQAVSQQQYVERIAEAIIQVAKAIQGRMFVLFTSQQMLKDTAERITELSQLQEYMLFAQGVTSGSRMKMIKSFRKFPKSILLGTNSFWEGVDVPGDELAAVIVVRLPFSSPDDPVFKMKSQQMQLAGVNAFQQLSLPEAIIRFKQGFGRLVRSSRDRGAFIVLDRRIESKSYGKHFLRALPCIETKNMPLDDMVNDLEHWYNNKE